MSVLLVQGRKFVIVLLFYYIIIEHPENMSLSLALLHKNDETVHNNTVHAHKLTWTPSQFDTPVHNTQQETNAQQLTSFRTWSRLDCVSIPIIR